MRFISFSSLFLLSSVACSPERGVDPMPERDLELRVELSTDAEREVLAAVNQLDEVTLDLDVGLDVRAARHIVEHRAGPDGLDGTSDDDRFDSIDELDAVPYVGPAAIAALQAWTELYGGDPREVRPLEVHGHVESGVDAMLILAVANTADFWSLDEGAGVDSRAAQAIVDHRGAGIATLTELDALSYVGPSAFGKLLDYAIAQEIDPIGGCPSGIVRDQEGTVYPHIGRAMWQAPNGAEVTVCPGTYGSAGWGHHRDGADLSLLAVGEVDLHGYYNFTGGHFQVSGFTFHGLGGGLNVYASTGSYVSLTFTDRSHAFAVDSTGTFEDLHADNAQEFKLKNGDYLVTGARFENMWQGTSSYHPVYFTHATVQVEYVDFLRNEGGALGIAYGAEVDFTSVNFGVGSAANPDGDIVIDGIVLSNMGSLWEYSCVSGVGCVIPL